MPANQELGLSLWQTMWPWHCTDARGGAEVPEPSHSCVAHCPPLVGSSRDRPACWWRLAESEEGAQGSAAGPQGPDVVKPFPETSEGSSSVKGFTDTRAVFVHVINYWFLPQFLFLCVYYKVSSLWWMMSHSVNISLCVTWECGLREE